MKNLLVYVASENAEQSLLAVKYIQDFEIGVDPDPKSMIDYDADSDFYSLVVVARYPHVRSKSGIQSVITLKVTDEQESFIESLPGAIEILGECDNNPDNDYIWTTPVTAHKNKFLAVVGNNFFNGSGTPGDEDYIPPRKKLAVLA